MKLVLIYDVGDNCTYWFERTVPIEYESAETLIVDFENVAKNAYCSDKWDFVFAGHTFDAYNFFENNTFDKNDDYICPKIMTVDEWFNQRGI
jgi:hypothetical protein